MPSGGHRFVFVGTEPLVLRVVAPLFVANTFLMLSLTFGGTYFLPKASSGLQPCDAFAEKGIQYHAPEIVRWYATHSISIQFTLLAALAAVFMIFHKRVRYIGRT